MTLVKCAVIFAIIAGNSSGLRAEQTLVTTKVERIPVVDGKGDDSQWAKAVSITTHDKIANIDVSIKAVHTKTEIAFLVIFPDPDESRTHKSWVWDKGQHLYTTGPDREDTFVFEWNMSSTPVDLSIYSGADHKSDEWFWKACRTDPVGYADDKYQVLSSHNVEKSVKITSKLGKKMYLVREGDHGAPAFYTTLHASYEGDILPRFAWKEPSGSCADVKAKGRWHKGEWTVEFKRALVTGQSDDVQFQTNERYEFGISRYENAGKAPDPSQSQPLYGAGDVGETLYLRFGR